MYEETPGGSTPPGVWPRSHARQMPCLAAKHPAFAQVRSFPLEWGIDRREVPGYTSIVATRGNADGDALRSLKLTASTSGEGHTQATSVTAASVRVAATPGQLAIVD
ncbi:hypothetical protein [Nocardia sp. CDC160]|uniref:hypothetical protein n=1 Tax=Nocardia sp. CDC160 TaxID=3112166 RepID=UPI002DB572CE|nr:hypothetical protein [Nocardia sp. CDC160]MEC3915533.1 hypothetical protein [Nocardia sp. CDC160]